MTRQTRTRPMTVAGAVRRYHPIRMRIRWLLVISAVLAVGVAIEKMGVGFYPGDEMQQYEGRWFWVVRVIDGDTLEIAEPDGEKLTTRVRLWGVNAPELAKWWKSGSGNALGEPTLREGGLWGEREVRLHREKLPGGLHREKLPGGLHGGELPGGLHGGELPGAVEALSVLRLWAEGRWVRLELSSHRVRGKFGRVLAYVVGEGGEDLGQGLLRGGWVRADDRWWHPRRSMYTLLGESARREKRGLWASKSR